MDKINVLLAEDEIALATIVKESLETRNFLVTVANNGREALELYQKNGFDVLLLDVMMPEKDGFTLIQEIRQENESIPIILLTSKSQTSDVVYGFKTGANDYIKKPFSIEELIVRVESLLGRQSQQFEDKVFKLGNYIFDFSRQTIQYETEVHALTFMEAKLLLMLIDNKNEIVDRSLILKKIWGSDTFFNGRSLDVFITKLRKKLSSDPNIKIINSRGHGYKIVF
ncbi:DNA-binding response regulator, OmpR family, contains REC and winged-helix (wHTH) domain [Lentimicrobium saccharophilum]|uniref:DNA-binding response regulator, OmpR family, contains REC and winged-helix (WHTH) domain n=1 Tax=Lentimicrobium saccharophilum TaxID=1678841 RepID=A0A0S7C2T1_9BACT|nr:response regulator transcription factor [Lentimicrobium saccharophilum]GAP43352.1 DNA-binding response regulator, OmpR family, contains REC and winged-helix (wHTH) domain [Lentimicrobium saccharophilum]